MGCGLCLLFLEWKATAFFSSSLFCLHRASCVCSSAAEQMQHVEHASLVQIRCRGMLDAMCCEAPEMDEVVKVLWQSSTVTTNH